MYINGEFKETREKQDVIDPCTGQAIAKVSLAGPAEINEALEAARNAFDHGPWPKLPLQQRKEFLLKISQAIFDHAAELARIEAQNTGKPIKEATFMDVPSAAKTFEYFANNLEKYLEPETINISAETQAQAKLMRQPQGVVVLIVPWNYPLLIAAWKMAQALAAGNAVVLKSSSLTPLSVLELAKIINACGLPKGAVNIINGSGAKLGQALCADPAVDMVSFTGSNEVGKQVINYASQNVKKLTIELGGKSAAVVLKDADLETAVNGLLCAIFLNQGQMCTAMSRIFVDAAVYEKFSADFITKAKKIKLGSSLDFETQMGPLISEAQRKKVIAYVEKAVRDGAKLLCGGKAPSAELKDGFFFEPTVLTDIKPDMPIFKEEVFGPVACLNKFSGIDEAAKLANSSEFGLAASIWTKDEKTAQELALQINAGTVWINTYGMFYNELPYGGFKQSGFGKELGREGFLEYTRLKNIVSDRAESGKPLVSYWYGF
ncbi:MAG: aldehyde dehydrogenase family protein [Candidatus Omnitrophota bacterium]